MGLDIFAKLDNQKAFSNNSAFAEVEKNSDLSRTFCRFMCRRNVVEDGLPELDQLGTLTGIDIGFLYKMEDYTEVWEMEEMLQFTAPENREHLKQSILAQNEVVENNIERVFAGLTLLIEKLTEIPDLDKRLTPTQYDTIGIKDYFSRFTEDVGDGYIGNNLGHDLRNLLRLVEFGIAHGSKGVYFHYG